MSAAPTINELRQQLFQALTVLHVAKLSLTTTSEGFDADECGTALEVVHKLVDDAAAALEPFAGGEGDAAARGAIAHAASVERGLRRCGSAQHPQLQTVHARMLQAAESLKQLGEQLAKTISN